MFQKVGRIDSERVVVEYLSQNAAGSDCICTKHTKDTPSLELLILSLQTHNKKSLRFDSLWGILERRGPTTKQIRSDRTSCHHPAARWCVAATHGVWEHY